MFPLVDLSTHEKYLKAYPALLKFGKGITNLRVLRKVNLQCSNVFTFTIILTWLFYHFNYIGKMMINIDLSATAFYESGPLINIVVKLLGKRGPDDLRR